MPGVIGMTDQTSTGLREEVRSRYAAAARAVLEPRPGVTAQSVELSATGSCCGTSAADSCCGGPAAEAVGGFSKSLYRDGETDGLPEEAVLAEMFRVLVPGGRIGITDVVAEDHLTPADRAAAGSYVGCIAGALSRAEYLDGLTAAGFTDPSVTFTTEAAPGLHSAIIRAVKPGR